MRRSMNHFYDQFCLFRVFMAVGKKSGVFLLTCSACNDSERWWLGWAVSLMILEALLSLLFTLQSSPLSGVPFCSAAEQPACHTVMQWVGRLFMPTQQRATSSLFSVFCLPSTLGKRSLCCALFPVGVVLIDRDRFSDMRILNV